LSLQGCDEDLEVGRIVASGPLVADAGRHRGLPLRGLRRGGPPWPPSPSPTGEHSVPVSFPPPARSGAFGVCARSTPFVLAALPAQSFSLIRSPRGRRD
jgi:hypothetical protein